MGIAVTPLRGGRRRRRRLLTRAAPLAIVAIAAFVAGAIIASSPGRAERRVVSQYASDWTRHDYRGMYALLDSDTRAHMSQRKFAREYTGAADT